MKPFIHDNFLLQNKYAIDLYHNYAAEMPIIDYHNHLSPKEIAENKKFGTITQVWLEGDHYKWRAMRANGVDEYFITGKATDWEKFEKWAETVPYTMRNPLYHWTHLELKRYFGIDQLLSPSTAKEIYDTCNELLQKKEYSVQGLLYKMNVETLCTTDGPADSLAYHKTINEGKDLKVLPTFRPDIYLGIEQNNFSEIISKLANSEKEHIKSYASLMAVLRSKIEYFHDIGCRLSDHGLSYTHAVNYKEDEIETIFQNAINGGMITYVDAEKYRSSLMYDLAKIYFQKGWTMQLHLGALRNNSQRLMDQLGADVGCDSIGDKEQAESLSKYLNRLDSTKELSKTIIYNLNPRDNEVFATMAGNFQDGTIKGKIQWGSAWWFLDQKDGMEKQINTLSNMGLLSQFIGMLTDSRSFLSYPRHEYFRRILCNLLGDDIEKGLLPNDAPWIGKMIQDICYNNAKTYLNL